MPILNNFQGFYYACTPKASGTTVAFTSLSHAPAKLVLPNVGIKRMSALVFFSTKHFPNKFCENWSSS
jgi:hypothetical protein